MSEKGKIRFEILRGGLIVLAATVISFLIGGGWHLLVPRDEFTYGLFYRLDSKEEEQWAWTMFLLFCGPAAGLAGAVISTAALAVRARRRKITS